MNLLDAIKSLVNLVLENGSDIRVAIDAQAQEERDLLARLEVEAPGALQSMIMVRQRIDRWDAMTAKLATVEEELRAARRFLES